MFYVRNIHCLGIVKIRNICSSNLTKEESKLLTMFQIKTTIFQIQKFINFINILLLKTS